MKNLEALNIINPKSFSHIELNGLAKLKWLQFEIDEHEIPLFAHVNTDLKVLSFSLQTKPISPESKSNWLGQIFNFRKLKAFTFSCTKGFDFDLDWLDGKNLEQFEQEFDDLSHSASSSLRYLNLKYLSSLKGSFSSFVNLQTLDLSCNPLVRFEPAMFDGLMNLKSLNLSNNPIFDQNTPCEILNGRFFSLEKLHLDETKSRKLILNKEIFRDLTNLAELSVSFNYLSIEQDAFVYLKRLRRLIMTNCALMKLPDGLFSPLVSLDLMDLSNNGITEMNVNTFKGCEGLRELRMYRKDLFDLNFIEVFSNFKNLKIFVYYFMQNELRNELTMKYPTLKLSQLYSFLNRIYF